MILSAFAIFLISVGIENTAVAEVMEEREVGTTNVGHRNERIKFIIEKMKVFLLFVELQREDEILFAQGII